MLQNDPLRLPPFHFDADPDPDLAFHFDAHPDPDPAFHFYTDPDQVSQNDADPDPQHGTGILIYIACKCLMDFSFPNIGTGTPPAENSTILVPGYIT